MYKNLDDALTLGTKPAQRATQAACRQRQPFLHAAAYWLLNTLRRWLQAAGAVRRQLDTLRLELLSARPRAVANNPG